MADVVDLSTLKNKTSNNPDFEDLTPEQQEALAAKAEANGIVPEEPKGTPVRTAFIVVVDSNGEVFVSTDLNQALDLAFEPSPDDIYGAAATIQRDMTVQMTASSTVMGMQQMAAAQAQRMQHAQIAAQLEQAGLKR